MLMLTFSLQNNVNSTLMEIELHSNHDHLYPTFIMLLVLCWVPEELDMDVLTDTAGAIVGEINA